MKKSKRQLFYLMGILVILPSVLILAVWLYFYIFGLEVKHP
jgi:hypothetical protein